MQTITPPQHPTVPPRGEPHGGGLKTPQYTWALLPLSITTIIVFTLSLFEIPLFLEVFGKSKELFSLFREQERAEELPQQIETIRKTISQLEHISSTLDSSTKSPLPLVDILYPYAHESKFTLQKVETGNPFPINNYHETSITIKGRGTYESIGSFSERIENHVQSTRIRQILMNNAEQENIDIVMEFVIISE